MSNLYNDVGRKNDDTKIMLELIEPILYDQLGLTMTFGCKKYGKDNWKSGLNDQRLEGAVLRHLNEFRKGHFFDLDSGLPHLSHVSANVMFLLWNNRERVNIIDYEQLIKEWNKRFTLK